MNASPLRVVLAALVLAGLVAACASTAAAPKKPNAAAADQPNVWLIVLDDATVDDVAAMPAVQTLLADQGVTFSNAYVPFPECCPSRATLLSGRYPHNHGVLDSKLPDGGFTKFDDSATLATWLDGSHRTGLVGKYLNGYGGGDSATYVPPGWDYWAAAYGTTAVYNYVGRSLNIDGTLTPFNNTYSTTLYGDLSRRFIAGAATGPEESFALVTNFVANHAGTPNEAEDPALPSPYVHPAYQDTVTPALPDDGSINEADVSDKPPYVSRRALLTRAQLADVAEVHAQRQEALRSADDQIAETMQALADQGQLDSTYVVLMSDNGYLEGQHRISNGKNVPYQPAVQMPLIVRGPGLPTGTTVDALVSEPDVAPTILSLLGQSGSHSGPPLDGRDLVPLIQGTETPTDRPVLLEIGKVDADPGPKVLRGIVTPDGWKFVDYVASSRDEMYDLSRDPYELDNLYDDTAFRAQQNLLRDQLAAYVNCEGQTCLGSSSSGR